MNVSFAESPKPPPIDLAAFAKRASDINVGGDVMDLGDDLGISMFTKTPASPGKQVSISSSSTVGTSSSVTTASSIPQIRIDPIADLDVMDIDTAPGISDIKIQRDVDPMPFMIGSGNANGSVIDIMGSSQTSSGAGSASASSAIATQKSEDIRKQRGLAKLRRLDAEGITGKNMTMSNTLEEIETEVDVRMDSKNLEKSLKWQRTLLTVGVRGVEMVASSDFVQKNRLLPFKPRLKGWNEQVQVNMADEFDPIFEELYDLYKEVGSVHPLLKLAGTLGLSAFIFHMASAAAESAGVAGMENDPEFQELIARKLMERKYGTMPSYPPSTTTAGPSGPAPINMSSSGGAASHIPAARREMKGPPAGVDDILQAFETERLMQTASTMPVPPPNSAFTPNGPTPSQPTGMHVLRSGIGTMSDPLAELDDASVGSGATDRRRGRPKKQTSLPVGATLDLNV